VKPVIGQRWRTLPRRPRSWGPWSSGRPAHRGAAGDEAGLKPQPLLSVLSGV